MVVLMLLLLIYQLLNITAQNILMSISKSCHIQIQKSTLGLALNKDNKALQEEINKAIADMKADGEFNTLYKKWFNVDAPADMPVVLDFK